MGSSKYVVKKKNPVTSKKKKLAVKEVNKIEVDQEEDGETDPSIKIIRISTEKKYPSSPDKLVINMLHNQDEDEVKEVVVKKQPVAPKECVQLAIQILKKIDPTRQKKKEEVIETLKEYKNQVNDLSLIQAVEYLLDSFENLEEKLEEFEEYRKVQETKLKATKLDKKIFHDRINLDLDKKEREPDENDRIFSLGKKVFSGNNQKYKKPKATDINRFRKLIVPKKDNKLLKKYNI